jgi:sulfonate transport system substrate-binding protein
LTGLYELSIDNLHERIEEIVMRTAYRHCDQNQLQSARLLGVSRNVVRARLIKYGELSGQLRTPSSPPPSSETRAAPSGTFRRVRIGYQNFGQLLLAKALGGLDRAMLNAGRRIEWVEFPGGMQLMDALHSGAVDLGVVGECPPVFAQAANAPIVYLAAEHGVPQGEAILVPRDSSISEVSQLRGKTVALNRGANVHYLLIRALEEAGVPYHQVNVRFLTPRDAQRAFIEGGVDAWAIWDPLLSSVKKELGARVLRDGVGLTQNNAYYVARRELTERAPEVIELVLQEVENAARYGRNHAKAAADLLAMDNNVDGEALESWLTGFSGAVSIGSAQVDAQQQIADSLFALKLVANPVRIADAQWGRQPRPHLQAS